MELKAQHICIIAHQFPPFGGVAGRRWLLFAHQLIKENIQVEVISAQGDKEKSSWKANSIDVTYLKDHFPQIVKRVPSTFIGKVRFAFWMRYIQFKFKGHPFDKGNFWIRSLQKYLQERTFPKDTLFIITGAPFSSFLAGEWIHKHGFRFILDYRDPYTWNNAYGFDSLAKQRQDFEKRNEQRITKLADQILVPNHKMLQEFLALYPSNTAKSHVLPHPIDFNSIQHKWEKPNEEKGEINLVYAGTVYNGCLAEFQEMLNWLNDTDHVHLTIYTKQSLIPSSLVSLFAQCDKVTVKDQVAAERLYELLSNYHACLIIQPARAKDYISTKFVDLVYCEMPIILHCEEGILKESLKGLSQVKVISNFKELLLKEWIQHMEISKEANSSFLLSHAGRLSKQLE